MPDSADMDAIELLTTRSSNGKLQDPAPDDRTLRLVLQAAAHAPDHAALRPLRVRVIRGAARERLGELMAQALRAKSSAASDEELAKMKQKALRAPLILAVCARVEPHPKVPASEQLLSAAAAAYAMLLALSALGFGAIWRTGDVAYDEHTKRAFGLRPEDAIIGFLYVGTPKQPAPTLHRPSPEELASEWNGPE